MLQQWLAQTTNRRPPPHRQWRTAQLRRNTGFPPYKNGSSPSLQRGGRRRGGAALKVAERRKLCAYPELARGGPQKLLVLGSRIGGRWNTDAQCFVRDLVRLSFPRAASSARRFVPWLGRTLVGSPFRRGLAVADTASGRTGPCARHGRPRRARPLAFASRKGAAVVTGSQGWYARRRP